VIDNHFRSLVILACESVTQMTQMTVFPISLSVDQINSAGKKFGISVIVVISVIGVPECNALS
jgi:hypothetical protein